MEETAVSLSDIMLRMGDDPFLVVTLLLTLGVIFVNGSTDAPNAIASCIATRCLSPRSAILMSAFFNFLGVFVMTSVFPAVTETVTQSVDFGEDAEITSIALSGALVSIVLWALLAWRFGIPTSESHALIAGLSGSAVAARGGFGGIRFSEWIKTFEGIVISTLLGLILGFFVYRAVCLTFKPLQRDKADAFFTKAEIFGAASMSFMHGAQDGQKFIGILLLSTCLSSGAFPDTMMIPKWIMALCSAVMALGTAVGGKKIIRTLGSDMVRLKKHQGFSADIAASLSLLVSTVMSLPVSTTHVKTSSIIGVGSANGLSSVNFSVVKNMALAWLLTFPGCGAIGFLATKIFLFIF